jgi:adenine-specific DNA-methyltransferase
MNAQSAPLGEICDYFQGLVTGGNEAYIVSREQRISESLERKLCKPVLFGDDIVRYREPVARYDVVYLTKSDDLDEYPNIRARLEPFKKVLQTKREVKLGRQPWYALHWPRERSNFEREEKILVQCIRNLALKRRVVATLDTQKQYADHTLNVVYKKDNPYDLRYVLAIMNSKLVNYLFQHKYVDINIKGIYLEEIPIRTVDFQDKDDLLIYDRLIQLVNSMLALNEQALNTNASEQLVLIDRQLNSIDDQIDELVYEMYKLDSNERDIVSKSL